MSVTDEVHDLLVHTALTYDSPEDLATRLAPVVQGWLSNDDRVVVNIGAQSGTAVKSALGADAQRVRWSDSGAWNPHPVRRLRAIQELAEDAARTGSGPLRFVGECAFPAGPPEMIEEWERFDAVLNEVLSHAAMTMVCAYDTQSVPNDVLGRVRCSHPFLGLEPFEPSGAYLGPDDFLASRRRALSPVPRGARHLEGEVSPAQARQMVRDLLERGEGHMASPTTRPRSVLADDMAVSVTEIVTNAWQNGATRVDVSCWRAGGEYVLQVDDDGPGLPDLYAGYRRPLPSAFGGRGLWIVRQLADLVEVAPREPGTAVRVRFFERGTEPAGG